MIENVGGPCNCMGTNAFLHNWCANTWYEVGRWTKIGRQKKLYNTSSPLLLTPFTLLLPWILTLACKNSRLATSSSSHTFFAVYTRTWNNSFHSCGLVEEIGFESQIAPKSSQLQHAAPFKNLPKFEKDLYCQPCCVPKYPLMTIMKNVPCEWSKFALDVYNRDWQWGFRGHYSRIGVSTTTKCKANSGLRCL